MGGVIKIKYRLNGDGSVNLNLDSLEVDKLVEIIKYYPDTLEKGVVLTLEEEKFIQLGKELETLYTEKEIERGIRKMENKYQEALKNISDYFEDIAEGKAVKCCKEWLYKNKEAVDTTITEMDNLKEENAKYKYKAQLYDKACNGDKKANKIIIELDYYNKLLDSEKYLRKRKEELEEEFGCPLEVVNKVLKNGMWYKKFEWNPIIKFNNCALQTLNNEYGFWCATRDDDELFIPLKDYNKTWWLEKPEEEK